MEAKTVALAGGSGLHRSRNRTTPLLASGSTKVRVLNAKSEKARAPNCFAGSRVRSSGYRTARIARRCAQGRESTIVDANPVGRPIRFEKSAAAASPSERMAYAARSRSSTPRKQGGVQQFIYISGAAADENSTHPAFRAKGFAPNARSVSRVSRTRLFRPSLAVRRGGQVVKRSRRRAAFTRRSLACPAPAGRKFKPVAGR